MRKSVLSWDVFLKILPDNMKGSKKVVPLSLGKLHEDVESSIAMAIQLLDTYLFRN